MNKIKSLVTVSDDFHDFAEKKSNFVVFTDAMSVLQALENDSCKDKNISHQSSALTDLRREYLPEQPDT